jgi:hypothetical protein
MICSLKINLYRTENFGRTEKKGRDPPKKFPLFAIIDFLNFNVK